MQKVETYILNPHIQANDGINSFKGIRGPKEFEFTAYGPEHETSYL
jgi:hypothetical protein